MIFVILLSIVAALFTAMPTNRMRFWGFTLFALVDAAWIGYGIYLDDALIWVQFLALMIAACMGMWFNRR